MLDSNAITSLKHCVLQLVLVLALAACCRGEDPDEIGSEPALFVTAYGRASDYAAFPGIIQMQEELFLEFFAQDLDHLLGGVGAGRYPGRVAGCHPGHQKGDGDQAEQGKEYKKEPFDDVLFHRSVCPSASGPDRPMRNPRQGPVLFYPVIYKAPVKSHRR